MQRDAQRLQAELGEIKEMLKGIQEAMEWMAQMASQLYRKTCYRESSPKGAL